MKVLIRSFSYKRAGYPPDVCGNGGGFVFDCRAIGVYDYSIKHNPEAPEPHFYFTGRDQLVRDVMDRNARAQRFFNAVWALVVLNLAKAVAMKLDAVEVNFGCTAGRHRSVYMAEKLAKAVAERFPEVIVELTHLEEATWPRKVIDPA